MKGGPFEIDESAESVIKTSEPQRRTVKVSKQ